MTTYAKVNNSTNLVRSQGSLGTRLARVNDYSKSMTEIRGKLSMFQVSAGFELARVKLLQESIYEVVLSG